MKKIALTGDRPTGPLHLGHYVGSLQNRLKLQETHEQFVMVADVQALTDHYDRSSSLQGHIVEVMKDYLSVGLDPKKTTFFLQSQIPEIPELTLYFMNLVTVARLERNPTVKAEIQQKAMETSLPAGFLCYPVNQAADITILGADVVPVGGDQMPLIEQTNEIVRRFQRTYASDCLKECQPLLGETQRLMGIDGKNKASKSLNNAIFLKEDLESVKQKVFQMFTDPDHLRVSDPGKVEGNVVFHYLDAFHGDQNQVDDLKAHYQKGGLGDRVLKDMLYETLAAFLQPIHEKRQDISSDEAWRILEEGTLKTRERTRVTMSAVRNAMGLRCF